MNKLTIVTITRDNYDQLVETVESTVELREKYSIQQIIIDTSKTSILEKNKNFIQGKKNITYYSGTWSGISKSYNEGISKVNDGWIWLLNASDCVHPNLNLEMFLGLLNASSAEMIIFNIEGAQSKNVWKKPGILKLFPPLLWIPQPGVIVRKETLNSIGKFDERLKIALDLDYWLRAFTKNIVVDLISIQIAVCDENGISRKQPGLAARETITVIFKNLSSVLKFILLPVLKFKLSILIYLKQMLLNGR